MRTTSATWDALHESDTGILETKAVINGAEYTDISAPVITRAAMQDAMSVGNVISASCVFAIRTTDAIPKAAKVEIYSRYNDEETQSEWLAMGTFFISKRQRDPVSGVLALECYDSLLKSNSLMDDETPLVDENGTVITDANNQPVTLADSDNTLDMKTLAENIAYAIGVEIDARTTIREGAIYTVTVAASATMRDVLSQIAAANAGNWIVTPENKLRLVPVVSSANADSATTNVAEVAAVVGGLQVGDERTVTGVQYTYGDEAIPVLIGDDTGFVMNVTLPYAQANALSQIVIGMTYRPYTFTNCRYNPAAEIGDYIRYGETAAGVLWYEVDTYNVVMSADASAPDFGEIEDEYPYVGMGQKTLIDAKAYALEKAQEATAALDDSLQQEEIFNRLTNNGAEQGLILYNGKVYLNASYINAGTISADIIKGGVLKLGGQNNINGTMEVYDASGNLAGTITNSGIYTGDSNKSAVLNSGMLRFERNGVSVGRIWSGTLLGGSAYLFINGPESSSSSSTGNRSAINFWASGDVEVNTGDNVARLSLFKDGTVSIVGGAGTFDLFNSGNAGVSADGDISNTADGDISNRAGGDNGSALILYYTGLVQLDGSAGHLRLFPSGVAELATNGTAIIKSGGDASIYLTDGGDTEIRSAGGASTLILKSDGTVSVNNSNAWRNALGLSNVENTKLSTWAGSSHITTVGTITTGTWQGTPIAAAYIGNHSTDKLTSGTLGAARGGTGQSTYTIGDILYCSAANTLSKLSGNTTTTRKFLRSVASTAGTAVAPAWDTITKADVGLSNVENTKLSTWTGSSNITTVGTITTGTWHGTPIAAAYIGNHSTDKLTSGTLGAARGGTGAATTGPNKVFAGPSSGSASAAPSFRALAAADIPSIGAGKVTSGTFTSARMIKEKTFTGMTANTNGNWAITGLTLSNAIVVSVYLTSTTNRVPVPWVYYASASSVGQWEIKFLNASGLAIVTGDIAGTLHVLYMEP